MRFFGGLGVAGLLLLALAGGAARAQVAPADARGGAVPAVPMLRLNAEMHTGPVHSITTDRSGSLILTTGADQVAKLWSAQNGRLLRTLRVPTSGRFSDRPFIGALSPDGRIAAISSVIEDDSAPQWHIDLFDTADGQMLRQLPVGGIPLALAFSRDGQFLAVGQGASADARASHSGITAFATATWAEVAREQNTGDVFALDIGPRGTLVASTTGAVILYSSLQGGTFHRVASQVGLERLQPRDVVFSPAGDVIAVGFRRANAVDLVSATDLNLVTKVDVSQDSNTLTWQNLAWSADGRVLYGAGCNVGEDGGSVVTAWADGGRGAMSGTNVGGGNCTTALATLPQGGIAYASSYPAWGIVHAPDEVRQGNDAPDPRKLDGNLLLADDGHAVQFCLDPERRKCAIFDAAANALRPLAGLARGGPMQPTAGFSRPTGPVRSGSGVGSTAEEVYFNGHRLHFDEKAFVWRVAASQRIAVVSHGHEIVAFDANGRQIWKSANGGVAWDVQLSADGRFCIAAMYDRTYRWFRLSDGAPLLTFHARPDLSEWVTWTPNGYFQASRNGEELFGWQLNRGPDKAADFFPAARFADTMKRHDIVLAVLQQADEARAVALANAASGRSDAIVSSSQIAALLPPAIDLIAAPAEFSTDRVSIRYAVRTPPEAPVLGALQIRVNGQWQAPSRGLARVLPDGARAIEITGLPPRDATIELYARNQNATSAPLVVKLAWKGRAGAPSATAASAGPAGQVARKAPNLFVLAIGVSQYQRAEFDLGFAGSDAQNLAAALLRQKGRRYAEVNARVLTNREATAAGIRAGLDWLKAQVNGEDVGIVFLAGHGFETRDGSYYFASTEFDPEHPRETGVGYQSIRDALVQFARNGNRTVFLIDTCHSGGAVGTTAGKAGGTTVATSNGEMLAAQLQRPENAVVVLTASTADQSSYEAPKWGGGAFTRAILEAVNDGKADPEASGTITVLDLGRYVSKRVPILTDSQQSPLLMMPAGGLVDFPIAASSR